MKKKIVFFLDLFTYGGIENFVCNVCSRLPRDKYNLEIWTNYKGGNQYDQFLEMANVRVIVLLSERVDNPLKRLRLGLRALERKILEDNDVTIHFNVSNSIDLLYVRKSKKLGVRNRLVHSHNSNAKSLSRKVSHYILKPFLCKVGTMNMACSEKAAYWLFSKKYVKDHGYIFVRNGINVEKYKYNEDRRKMTREENNWENKFVVGHIGRFNLQKNHLYLIDIFEELCKSKENAILVLVGEGARLDEVRKYVLGKKLADKVQFYGTTSDIPDLMAAMDLFLLPSLYEGLPFVLVESQASALPAIVSDAITKEVKLTEFINYMPIVVSPNLWAEKCLAMSNLDRIDTSEEIKKGGFEIADVVKELDKIYSNL